MEQAQHTLTIETHGPGFTDLTRQVAAWLGSIAAKDGLLTLFVRHTSASLTIQENADPDVLRDLADDAGEARPARRPLPPRHRGRRRHAGPHQVDADGDEPRRAGRRPAGRVLGTWQAIYLIEHRDRPHTREIVLHFAGTRGR